MAAAAVQHAPGTTFGQVLEPLSQRSKPEKHNVATELHYYKENEDGSPPAPAYVGDPSTFFREKRPQSATVHDVAGDEDKYTLDSHGFQFLQHESKEKDFLDHETIKAQYYPEVAQLLKDTTGASRVLIFDHTIRRPQPDAGDSAAVLRGPVYGVHIDQSYTASEGRVKHHLPDEADELLKKRFQIINVWRPIKTIFKDPLGFADAHSVSEDDLVPVALIYPDREGATFQVKANPNHRWYFKHAQRPDEPVLIKCYDSLDDGRARRIPHTAFANPEYVDAAPRESIEVRTLVFYD